MSNRRTRAVQMGCGPIGCSISRLAASRSGIEIVGAVDPAYADRDLGEVADDSELTGVKISGDALATIQETDPDVVLHATGSSLESVLPQFETVLSTGVNVVSTCEELSYPYFHQPELSQELNEFAVRNNATVLATGVNPGFLMDIWPVFMTGISQKVESVVGIRLQDATHRRHPFQKKIGAGLSVDEFQQRVNDGKIRHVGLPESVAMVAAGLGWRLDDVIETIEPVVADQAVRSQELTVDEGQVAGVRQEACGVVGGADVIRLEFNASIGARDPYDAVYIKGLPDLEVVIQGGVHGDLATASVVVNAVPRAVAATPGLITMIDIPPVAAFG